MSNHNEGLMPMQDAPASLDTQYSFEPVNGRYLARHGNNTFDGTLNPAMGDGEDWIAIELQAGRVYTITVTGRDFDRDDTDDADGDGTPDNDFNPLEDPILMVLDDKGGVVAMNDDNPDNMAGVGVGDLSSKIEITPDEDGKFYISVSAFGGNPGSPNDGDYQVTVVESDPIPDNVGKTLAGTAGNDKINGTDLDDTINGNDGDDALYGGAGDDTLRGGVDNMPAAVDPATDDTDTIGGNDLLVGGPGADVLWGGDGVDTISYKYSTEGVHINLMTGIARGGEAGGDSFGNPKAEEYENDIENVQGSNHDDDITGDVMDNMIWGYDGNDDLSGGDGDDTLNGGAGDDSLSGGDDDDTLIGGYGADVLTGGDNGMMGDTASYMGSMMGVTVRLHSLQAMGGDAEGDTFGGTVTYEHTVIEDEDEPPVDTESTAPDIENLRGSGNDDILSGDGRANTIWGGAGDDKIYGGPGGDGDTNDDMLHGEDGNDMIFGGVGDDTMTGGDGNDMLHGGPGTDTYDGGAGNDMIYADLADITGRDGTTPFDGGENPTGVPGVMPDSDTVSFARLTDDDGGVSVALAGSIYVNIENVIGTDFADTITGNDDDNIIEGGDSGDTLNGGATSTGDTLSYASSDKRVRADLALNTFVGGHANNDDITEDSFENLIGSDFNDVLTGDERANKLTGGDGDDELEGAAGDDTLSGGAGEDDLSGGAGDDTLEGGAGADELDGGDDPAPATTGTPAERSTARSDAVKEAANTLSYASSDAGVTVNLATAMISGGHAQGDEIEVYEDVDHDNDEAVDNSPDDGNTDTLEETDTARIDVSSFRHATGSDHNDSITGDYRMNVLNGMKGDDNIRGGLEWDMLIGGPGADTLNGGESGGVMDEDTPANNRAEDVDWAVYRHAEGGVSVNLNTMMGTGGDAMGDELIGIELVWGSEDMENGDMFIAGAGPDKIHGDFGPDTLSYEASRMGVYVDLSTQPAWDDTDSPTNELADAPTDNTEPGEGTPTDDLAAAIGMASAITASDVGAVTATPTTDPEMNINGAAGDMIGGIQNLTGSGHDDFLVGDATDNTLMGGAGDDLLSGGAGDDMLHGGAGEDRLFGGDNDDTLMGGDDNDMLAGGEDDDTLNGGDGHDELDGGGGADKVNGGAGDDELTGGGAADEFIFDMNNGFDYIVDFADNEDKIDLSAYEDIESIEDLNIRDQGTSVVIDLSAHGGDRITVQSIQLADEALQGTAGSTGLDNGDFIFA